MRYFPLFAAMLFAGSASLHAQWQLQDSHNTASLRGVAYVGKGVAWASGTGGTVLHTNDMGKTWQRCATPQGAEKLDFRGVQAFDENVALVMSSGKGDLSRVYKTTDGCQTWMQVFIDPNPQGFFDCLFFKDKKTGFLFGDPVEGAFFVAETTDGGDHWIVRHDKGLEVEPGMGGIFAASNTSAAMSNGRLVFGSGGRGGAWIHQLDSHTGEWTSTKAPLGVSSESAGFFGISADGQIAVGGDYQRPDDGSASAIYKKSSEWLKATAQPHGYRSAVAYDLKGRVWLTVGPNGTDMSRDKGITWQPLAPNSDGDADEDKQWNALSLPFVVGSRGRIGLLRENAVKGTNTQLPQATEVRMTIYAATSNNGKLREFAESASGDGIEVLALPGLASMPEPVEDAVTFMGNAELKAIAYSRLAPGLLVFADDSGLEVEALGGKPGVRSARFADDLGFEVGHGSKDERNNRCVLSLLAALPDTPESNSTRRAARFVCALALAHDGEVLLRAESSVEGEMLHEPRGSNGFGYDPLFLIPSLCLTTAELPAEQKWHLSHRGKAFRKLLAELVKSGFDQDRTR